MKIEVKIKSSLYTDPDEKGKQKLIKRNIITKRIINVDDKTAVEEVIDNKGKILKNCCRIFTREEPIVVNHNYEYIKNLILKEKIVIKGYRK